MLLFSTVLPFIIVFAPWQNHRLRNRDVMPLTFLFTVVLSAILSLFTKAKQHEILAATAAYATCCVPVHSFIKADIPEQVLRNPHTDPKQGTTG